MTPELAQKYLDTQINNRKANNDWVNALAQSIARGEWVMDGNSIKMDDAGHLIDGQHRLRAVVKSGITVPMEVKSGFNPNAIYVIDAFTKSRSLADVATLNKIPNGHMLSTVIKNYYTEAAHAYSWTLQRLSPANFIRIYNEDPFGWQDVAKRVNEIKGQYKDRLQLIPANMMGGMYAFLVKDKGYSGETVADFFKQLCSTNPAKNVTIEKLRSLLIKDSVRNKRYTTAVKRSMVVKAWNAYITGTHIKSIQVKADEARVEFI